MNQYKLVGVGNKTLPTLEAELNELAAEDWCVVASVPHKAGSALVLVRWVMEPSNPIELEIFRAKATSDMWENK